MGAYNIFGDQEIQLKIGDCAMLRFSVGDEVPLSDGLYVGYEGWVVVKDGKLVATFTHDEVVDKWGVPLKYDIQSRNPMIAVVDEAVKRIDVDETVKRLQQDDNKSTTVIIADQVDTLNM